VSTSEHEEKSRLRTRDRRLYMARLERSRVQYVFHFRLVPEAFNREPMHRKGKPYHLFSHIFLPPFAHIISITHAGLVDPCVIGIIFHKLRSKYMRKQMVDFNAIISNIYFDRAKDIEGHNCYERMFNMTNIW